MIGTFPNAVHPSSVRSRLQWSHCSANGSIWSFYQWRMAMLHFTKTDKLSALAVFLRGNIYLPEGLFFCLQAMKLTWGFVHRLDCSVSDPCCNLGIREILKTQFLTVLISSQHQHPRHPHSTILITLTSTSSSRPYFHFTYVVFSWKSLGWSNRRPGREAIQTSSNQFKPNLI